MCEKWQEYYPNVIESFNSIYHRLNRQRSVFPSDTSLLKALYISIFKAIKNGIFHLEIGIKVMVNYQ